MDYELTKHEIEGLRELGKMHANILSEGVKESLISKGLVLEIRGNLKRTPKGELWLKQNGR